MRGLIFVVLPLLAACAQTGDAVNFRDPATGQVASVCGPLTGLSVAVTPAHDGCIEAYQKAGWTRMDAAGTAVAQARL